MNKRESVNKGGFIDAMVEGNNYTKTECEKFATLFLETIVKIVKSGKGLNLVSYFSLDIQDRPAREGRNPKTGEKMQIQAYKQPVFRAGKKIKDACNE